MSEKFYKHKNFGDMMQQTILPIFAIADDEVIPLGTGFVIMQNGLLMTAKHVIEEFSQPKVKKINGNGYYSNVSIYALFISNEKSDQNNEYYNGGHWRILKVSYLHELDIALCWLQGMIKNNKPFYFKSVLKLSFDIPEIGSNIAGFGYYKSFANFSEKNKVFIDYSQETAITEGKIMEIKSNEGFRKFPHLRVDARFEPGMSGGPIFNEKGCVCGVICSSVSGCTDESGYISYVSLLWPSVAIKTETTFDNDPTIKEVTILDLINKNFISTDDSIKNVELINDKTGNSQTKLKILPKQKTAIM